LDFSRAKRSHWGTGQKLGSQTASRQQSSQLGFDCELKFRAAPRFNRKPVQYQSLDVKVDIQAVAPASLMGSIH
jgi:hypothetical protein